MKKLRGYQVGAEILVAMNLPDAIELAGGYHIFRNIATGNFCKDVNPLKGNVIVDKLDEDNHEIRFDDFEDSKIYKIFAYSDEVRYELNRENKK